jgi:hypothetical protein
MHIKKETDRGNLSSILKRNVGEFGVVELQRVGENIFKHFHRGFQIQPYTLSPL